MSVILKNIFKLLATKHEYDFSILYSHGVRQSKSFEYILIVMIPV